MERTEILAAMAGLKLFGMKAAARVAGSATPTRRDEIVATAVKRQHEPPRVVGDWRDAELSEKQARAPGCLCDPDRVGWRMTYQLTVAKLPFAKELDEFVFADTPINEPSVRHLAAGGCLAQQRNLVLVGGTGSGKT